MAWSDSDNEELPAKKRRTRSKFKGLRARLAEINVDTYRSLASIQEQPFGNAESFFQERLLHWKEMDMSTDFRDVVGELEPMMGSLAQIVHHRNEILDIILEKCSAHKTLSIESLTDLLAGLSRDLQDLFLPMLPRAMLKLSNLVHDLCHDPSPLQSLVRALSLILRNLSKLLMNKIPWVLEMTRSMRSHRVAHVRKLAAQSVAYLFRQAKPKKLRVGLKSLLAEACTRVHDKLVINGIGDTIVEICVGIQGKLHTSARDTLAIALDSTLLSPTEFKKGSKGKRMREADMSLESMAPAWLTLDTIRSRCNNCVLVAVEKLSQFVKKGSEQCALADAVLEECITRAERYQQECNSCQEKQDDNLNLAARDLGRGLGCVALLLDGFKGRNALDMGSPLKLASMLGELSIRRSLSSSDICHDGKTDEDCREEMKPGYPAGQALKLYLAIIAALQERNMSHRMDDCAKSWSGVIIAAEPEDICRFSWGLVGALEFAIPILISDLLVPLCAVVEQRQSRLDDPVAVEALLTICELAQRFKTQTGMGVPRLMIETDSLAKHVMTLLSKWKALPDVPFKKSDAAVAWLGLQCLPQLSAKPSDLIEICQQLILTGQKLVSSMGPACMSDEELCLDDVILLQARAKSVLGRALNGYSKAQFVAFAQELLTLLREWSGKYCVLETAAEMMSLLRQDVDEENCEGGSLLNHDALVGLLPLLGRLLSDPSQKVRKAALILICCFEQPMLKNPRDFNGVQSDAMDRCNVFKWILEIEKQPMSLKNEQRGVVLTDTLESWMKADRIPTHLISPILNALTGMMFIRFSRLWKPLSATLGVAISKYSEATWSLLFPLIQKAQRAVLDGAHLSLKSGIQGDVTLIGRMRADLISGGIEASGGHTDHLTCLCHHLDALRHSQGALLEEKSVEWVDSFLYYVLRRPDHCPWRKASEELTIQQEPGQCTISEWRKGLAAWLSVIQVIPQPRRCSSSGQLLQTLATLLSESSPDIQQQVLLCLKNFKVKHLGNYFDSLMQLTDAATMKEELVRFHLGDASETPIPEKHRRSLILLLTTILHPKFQRVKAGKLKGLNLQIVHFIGSMRDLELKYFLGKVLLDFTRAFSSCSEKKGPDLGAGVNVVASLESQLLLVQPPWVEGLDKLPGNAWLSRINGDRLLQIPVKTVQIALDNVATLLGGLGFKLQRFIAPILALLTHILEGFTMNKIQQMFNDPVVGSPVATVTENGANGAADGHDGTRDECKAPGHVPGVQRQCLELISSIWIKFPDSCDHSCVVERVLKVVKPWVGDLTRVDAQTNSRELVLQIACALSSDVQLSRFLAPSVPQEHSGLQQPDGDENLGFNLLSEVVKAVSCLDTRPGFHESVLTVMDNLLNQEDVILKTVLLPHVPNLLDALKQYIVAVFDGNVPSEFIGSAVRFKDEATHEMLILEKISCLDMDDASARNLTYAMLPLITCPKGRKKASIQMKITMRALKCLTEVWAHVSRKKSGSFSQQETHSICCQLAPLASHLTGQGLRMALSTSFATLAGMDKSLEESAQLFVALNSFTESLTGDVDYDERLTAYRGLSKEFWSGLCDPAVMPLMHTCLYDLANPDDISLRQAASEALSRMILALGTSSSNTQLPPIIDQVYKQLCKNVGAQDLAVRQEHLARVRQIIIDYPDLSRGLLSLVNVDDNEHDFFHNVSHLQLHRRARAWVQLSKGLELNKELATNESMVVLVPLFLQTIFDGRALESTSRRVASQEEVSRESTVVAATIQVLSSLASRLNWEPYARLLRRLLGAVNRSKAPSKGMFKALCAVVDALPFDLVDNCKKDALEEIADEECEDDNGGEGMKQSSGSGEAGSQESGGRIWNLMLNRAFPILKKFLIDEEDKARPPVAASLVRLLQRAPKGFEAQELKGILLRVANLIKHRWQGVRDDARMVFIGMAKELGSKYILLLVEVLKAALPARGFAVHVLGYTIHAVLEALSEMTETGDMDAVVDIVLPIVDEEIFGEVADAKEVKQFIANYREAKTCRAYETLYLLVKSVSFEPCGDAFVEFARSHLHLCGSPKLRNRLSDLLVFLAKGLLDNKSVEVSGLMVFIHEIVDVGMAVEEKAISKAQATAGMAGLSKLSMKMEGTGSIADRYEPLLVEFALKLLHNGLKKGRLDVQDVGVLGLLDPFLPLLVRCLKSRHSPVSVLALKCICFMVRLPLPGLQDAAKAAGNTVLTMLEGVGSSADPVAQDGFGFLARILAEGNAFQPTNDQVKSLLVLIDGELEEHAQRHSGFALLGAMLDRKILVAGIYDMMNKVQCMMVRSHSTSIRHTCGSLLVRFLLTYPLGEVRLIDHLKFILTNLSYEFEAGRIQVLQVLAILMRKFPAELLEVQAEFFYLPLVVRLANDDSKSCREQISEVVKAMLKRIGAASAKKLMAVTMKWLCSQDQKLKQIAAQAMGFFAEAFRSLVVPVEGEILDAVVEVLHRHSLFIEHDQLIGGSSGDISEWQEAYSMLMLLEKLIENLGSKFEFLIHAAHYDDADEIKARVWSYVVSMLRYRHAWVRKSAVRLVMQGLAAMGAEPKEGEAIRVFGGKTVMQLAFSLVSTIEAECAEASLVMDATKCLLWIAPSLQAASVEEWEKNECTALESSDLEEIEENVEADADADADPGKVTKRPDRSSGKSIHMFGLMRRMAAIADNSSPPHQAARVFALKFFAALTTRLGATSITKYLPTIMVPFYRLLEPSASNRQSPELQDVAQEVQLHINQVVGGDLMLQAYNHARRKVQTRRQDRKRREKLQKINDPEAAARRRIQKNRSRLEGRKRVREYRRIVKAVPKRTKRK